MPVHAHNKKRERMALITHKSASVPQPHGMSINNDPRIVRTRRQLDAAFIDLLQRRAYGRIRVADIARKAGVGRATFYAHYCSKDDLLRSQFTRTVAPMFSLRADSPCPLDVSALFVHVKATPRIYRALIFGPDAGSGPRILRECAEQRVGQLLAPIEPVAQFEGPGSLPRNTIVSRFVASSLLAILELWVERSSIEPPNQVQAIFDKLVGGGLAAFAFGSMGSGLPQTVA